ncbi:MAG TPA: hypothetical protein EYP22_09245 [Methanosarcinales archaeon]|nr:hypothetical protein [Methanosarcinales archaeon]
MQSIQGIYKNGIIMPLEKIPVKDAMKVIITFVEEIKKPDSENIIEELRLRQGKKVAPELQKKARLELKKISEKFNGSLPFKTPEEAIAISKKYHKE